MPLAYAANARARRASNAVADPLVTPSARSIAPPRPQRRRASTDSAEPTLVELVEETPQNPWGLPRPVALPAAAPLRSGSTGSESVQDAARLPAPVPGASSKAAFAAFVASRRALGEGVAGVIGARRKLIAAVWEWVLTLRSPPPVQMTHAGRTARSLTPTNTSARTSRSVTPSAPALQRRPSGREILRRVREEQAHERAKQRGAAKSADASLVEHRSGSAAPEPDDNTPAPRVSIRVALLEVVLVRAFQHVFLRRLRVAVTQRRAVATAEAFAAFNARRAALSRTLRAWRGFVGAERCRRDALLLTCAEHWVRHVARMRAARTIVRFYVARVRAGIALRRQHLLHRAWLRWHSRHTTALRVQQQLLRGSAAHLSAEQRAVAEAFIEDRSRIVDVVQRAPYHEHLTHPDDGGGDEPSSVWTARASSHVAQRVCRRAFDRWHRRVLRRQQERYSGRCAARRLANIAWLLWRDRFARRVALAQQRRSAPAAVARRADAYNPYRDGSLWIEPPAARLEAAACVYGASLKFTCFRRWRVKFTDVAATRFYVQRRVDMVWRRWRAACAERTVVRLRTHRTLLAWWQQYALRVNARACAQLQQDRRLERSFAAWRDEVQAVRHWRSRTASALLHKWNRRAAVVEVVRVAARVAEDARLCEAIRRWREMAADGALRWQRRQAAYAFYTRNVLRRPFAVWATFVAVRVAHRHSDAVTAEARRHLSLKARWVTWRRRFANRVVARAAPTAAGASVQQPSDAAGAAAGAAVAELRRQTAAAVSAQRVPVQAVPPLTLVPPTRRAVRFKPRTAAGPAPAQRTTRRKK